MAFSLQGIVLTMISKVPKRNLKKIKLNKINFI